MSAPPPYGPPPTYAPSPAPPTPERAARLGWIAFGLVFVAPISALLAMAGISPGPLGFLALPSMIAAVVLAILALRRRARPRWPAVTALAIMGAGAIVWAAIAVWAVVGFVQIMFLPTY